MKLDFRFRNLELRIFYFQILKLTHFQIKSYLRFRIHLIMIIYSVTISIEESVEEEWMGWMRKTHIPEVMNTGKFISCRFSRLTSHKEEGLRNYSAQYTCRSKKDLQDYQENFAKELQKKSMEKFADKMHAFRTELEVIEDFYSVLS